MFTHLNVHSQTSPMRGTAPGEALLDRARAMGMTHLALTDVNGLWGFIRFVQHARQVGIQAICGAHVLLNAGDDTPPDRDLVLLVETSAGYANLCRLLSGVHDDPQADPAELLTSFGAGLLVLCPDPDLLRRLAPVLPGDNLFGELRPGRDSNPILAACDELGREPVATGEVCLLSPDDLDAYRMLRAIDRNARLSELPEWELKSPAHYLAPEKEFRRRYPHCPRAVDNAVVIARRCHTDWD
ncbi:MAG: PHP domain-containing protein, partial [Candidatus Neomarinimicrobiota bacterium]